MGSPPHARCYHLGRLAALLLLCLQLTPAVAEMEGEAAQALAVPQASQESESRLATGPLPTEALASPPPTPLVAVPP